VSAEQGPRFSGDATANERTIIVAGRVAELGMH